MKADSRIFIAGHKGLIGSAALRMLQRSGYNNIIVRDKTALDLSDPIAVLLFFQEVRPEYVVMAAGRTGGIIETERLAVDIIHTNLVITLNVLKAANEQNVKKLIYFCSSCMYPSHCPQPMTEDMLLTGKPDDRAMPMAIAKLAGMHLCLAYNRQIGEGRFIPVIPNSTYGENDDFNPSSAHVLSALIHRFHEAKSSGATHIELWGSGNARREFVHVDDVARACLMLMETENPLDELPINIGVGEDYSISELAEIIADITGFTGAISWNTEKPDGAPQKLLDSSRITKLGWKPSIVLEEGIRITYDWYLRNVTKLSIKSNNSSMAGA